MRWLPYLAAAAALCACACGGGPTPEEKLRRAVIDFNGHVIVMKNAAELTEYRDVMRIAREESGVVAATPFMFVEGILNARGKTVTIAVKGIAPHETPVGKLITPPNVLAGYRPPAAAAHARGAIDDAPEDFGDAEDEEPIDYSGKEPPADPAPKQGLAEPIHAVIGVTLAREHGLAIGDVVDFILPPPIDYTTFRPRNEPPIRHPIRIVGMLETGAEYDERTMLTTFEAVQAMMAGGDKALGVELRISDERAAARVARALTERLGSAYTVMDWCELNKAALRCDL